MEVLVLVPMILWAAAPGAATAWAGTVLVGDHARRRFRRTAVAAGAVYYTIIVLALVPYLATVGDRDLHRIVAIVAFGLLASGLPIGAALAWHAHRLGRGELGDRCLECGYDLTGLDAARCPECGGRLPLRTAADHA